MSSNSKLTYFLIGLSGLFLSNVACTINAKSPPAPLNQLPFQVATVNPQVSFKTVTQLTSLQPQHKIAYGKDPLQYGLLWQAANQSNKPLIVMVHGGCWLNAFGVDHTYPLASALSQAGFPVWSLEYRRTGDTGGGWPGSFADIKLALNQLSLLKNHQINVNEVVLMGHSAGGHLALLAASEMNHSTFKQVFGLAAITDISRYALGNNSCQQATTSFMAGLPNERSHAFQTANLIYRKLPDNVTLLHGDADQIVPTTQSQLPDVTTEIIPEAGHFDWIHPGSPAFKRLLELLSD